MSAEVPGPLNLRRRPSRTLPALIASLLLLALAVALCWVAVERLVQGRWPQFLLSGTREASQTLWNEPAAWITGGILALLGLILLLCGLVPGGYRTLPVRMPPRSSGPQDAAVSGSGAAAVISRRGTARLAAATCEHIDGVSEASATAGDRTVRVAVQTALRETADLQNWVAEGVRSRLEASGLDPVPEVRVDVRSTA